MSTHISTFRVTVGAWGGEERVFGARARVRPFPPHALVSVIVIIIDDGVVAIIPF